jgi:hypothetical protein
MFVEVNQIPPFGAIPVGFDDWVANCTMLCETVNTGCCVVKFLIINKLLCNSVFPLLDTLKYVVLPDFIKNKFIGLVWFSIIKLLVKLFKPVNEAVPTNNNVSAFDINPLLVVEFKLNEPDMITDCESGLTYDAVKV